MFQGYVRYFRVLVVCLLWFTNATASLTYSKFEPGIHYQKINEKIRSDQNIHQLIAEDPNKIQVIMFFSYGCHVCNRLNQPFDKWASGKKDVVSIRHYPVIFNQAWEVFAKLYYTAEVLDPSGKLDDDIFKGLHKDGKQLWKPPVIAEFLQQRGYANDKFNAIYESFEVDRKIKRAKEISNAYQISATPNIIINGSKNSYYTNLTMTKNANLLFQVVDYLVSLEQEVLKQTDS